MQVYGLAHATSNPTLKVQKVNRSVHQKGRENHQNAGAIRKAATNTTSNNGKTVRVENQSKFMTYNIQNRETVRIVFGDGSVLVGTYFNRTV